jgi:hemolysin III
VGVVGNRRKGGRHTGRVRHGPALANASPKPRLRGWVHAVAFPTVTVAGLGLVTLAPTLAARAALAVYTLSAMLLFGVSALYHRGSWLDRGSAVLRRLDHANIFLLIAGTYTPYAVLLLPRSSAAVLLSVVWVGALIGLVFRVFWIGAPRWLYTPLYVVLGWTAVFWLGDFIHNGGVAPVLLMLAGGLAYSLGAVAYGLRRPDPWPTVFGFHEVFHACTVVGFACQYAGICVLVYSA